jgi:glycosyltransferase involved in cell wall biosynthesis
MSRGIPAVASDIPIFKEIGGEAALLFDPDSPDAFAKAIRSLESNPEWMRRSKLSIKQASRFNWDSSAVELIALARKLCN